MTGIETGCPFHNMKGFNDVADLRSLLATLPIKFGLEINRISRLNPSKNHCTVSNLTCQVAFRDPTASDRPSFNHHAVPLSKQQARWNLKTDHLTNMPDNFVLTLLVLYVVTTDQILPTSKMDPFLAQHCFFDGCRQLAEN